MHIFEITQANTHLFSDLYIANTMLVLVRSGAKRVIYKPEVDLNIHEGELLIFPSGSFITIENRIIEKGNYRAICLSYPDDIVESVFNKKVIHSKINPAIKVENCPQTLANTIIGLQSEFKLEESYLPTDVLQYKALEPLIWLKSIGIELAIPKEKRVDCQLRDLIASEPDKKWRIKEVSSQLGYSEATLRRKLLEAKTTFTDTLLNVRLETALALLQTTNNPISEIALQSGFSTPSHFSDVFKQRFKIQPKHIKNSKA